MSFSCLYIIILLFVPVVNFKLHDLFSRNAATLSIDDFYLTADEQVMNFEFLF